MYLYVYMWNLNGVMSYPITAKTTLQPDILYHHGKHPGPGMGCIQLNRWPKEPPGNFQTSQAITKDIGCSPQSDDKTLLLRVTHTSSNMEKPSWRLMRDFTPTRQCSQYWRCSAHSERKVKTSPVTNPSVYNMMICLHNILVQWQHKH